jgi:DNA-binding response OmpR family regulator
MTKILAIDDDAKFLAGIKKQLEHAGYEVITALDGMAGLQKARAENPNLIILGAILPSLDGYQICAILKHDAKYQHIPIIMLTARSQQSDIAEGMRMGADAYITRPFNPKELLVQIKKLLEPQPASATKPPGPAAEGKFKESKKPNWWEPEEK